MKVRFKCNLGSRDAAGLELDHAKCAAGEELEVSKASAEILAKRGIAEIVSESPKIKAVPKPAPIAEAKDSN